jgi:hypothetical protein
LCCERLVCGAEVLRCRCHGISIARRLGFVKGPRHALIKSLGSA